MGSTDPKNPDDSLLRVGESLGPYRIIRLLGKGGMGEVYEADDTESGRRVALKVLGSSLDSPDDRMRFLREGKLAAQISHPHCVYIYGTDEIDDTLVISMELVTGGTLKERVDGEGPLSVVDAVDAVLQMIDGLEAAEAQGVLHRDIKPANCFIDSDGSIKIGDFGLSISTFARDETQLTAAGTFLGTPAFASPEQLKGQELDLRSDIYSVGATLHLLLTGETPFHGRSVVEQIASIMGEAPASARELRPEIPAALAKVILRCLAKEREGRFPDYAELRAALAPFSSAVLAPAPIGRRFAAALFDLFVVLALVAPLYILMFSLGRPLSKPEEDLFRIVLLLVYFSLVEGVWGASLGKILFGLRLAAQGSQKPGIGRATIRALIFIGLFQIPAAVWGAAVGAETEGVMVNMSDGEEVFWLFTSYSDDRYQALELALLLLMFSTARRKNSFSGLHDLLSGTRVVTEAETTSGVAHDIRWEIERREEPGKRYGPYEIIGEVRSGRDEQLLLGYDRQLDRKAWIHVVARGIPAVPASRRDIGRPSRLRWLNGKRSEADPGQNWDAYEWVEGTTLASMLYRKHSWAAIRRWLLDLARELEHSGTEDSASLQIAPDRIWIAADGTAKLLDFSPSGDQSGHPIDFAAAQQLLHDTASAALAGAIIADPDELAGHPPPLPLHARAFLDDLQNSEFRTPTELVERLESVVEEQPVVPRRVRLGHFACWSFPPLMMSVLVVGTVISDPSVLEGAVFVLIAAFTNSAVLLLLAIPSMVTSTIFRGRLLFRLTGVAVVDRAGWVVSRPRAFFRSLMAWGLVIPAVGITLTLLITERSSGWFTVAVVTVFALLLTFFAGAVRCVITPERGPQDQLAGTYLVPQ